MNTAATPTATEMSLPEALELAQRLLRAGHLDEAERVFRAILKLEPDQPDAVHFLGVLLHHRGAADRALALIGRAAELMPDNPGPLNNLGNVLLEAGRVDDAVAAYRRCIERFPDFANPYNNLGTVLRARREWEAAESAYRRALELNPESADTCNNMANLLAAQGRIREALTWGCRAITLTPLHAGARKLLGFAYYTLGEADKAAQVYREWLADEPDNPVALHHLAACTGEAVPARASDAYVESTFDVFAGSFDAKLQNLEYRAPELVAAALARAVASAQAQLDVLDAGCGTGLCGPLLRPYARRLFGVDLSGNMLAKAQQRGGYDVLKKAELVACLKANPGAFDVIACADTLCYFGDLRAVAQAAYGALKANGLFIFTVELAGDAADGYRINPHGRYSHAPGYVQAVFAGAGLITEHSTTELLRMEGGLPVDGLVVTCRRPGATGGQDG